MSKTEKHETRLNDHDAELQRHDIKINDIDVKVDVIDVTTKGTAIAVGTLIKNKDKPKYTGEGTLNQRDWIGTLSILIFGLIQLGVMAWQLWSVQNGKDNIFLASLSVMAIPVIIGIGKSITGRDIKKSDTEHQVATLKKEKEHKTAIDKMSGMLQMKDVEIYGHKEKIARLEERTGKLIETAPPVPKLP